jgi:hypothetical protein
MPRLTLAVVLLLLQALTRESVARQIQDRCRRGKG